MQLEIPLGHTEQQVFFAEISAQGANWVERLRSRARDAVDRMAWAGMMELVPELRARQAEVACLGADGCNLCNA